MATVTQFWSDPVMQFQDTVEWSWDLGDRDFYWGFCVRPYQANNRAEVLRTIAVSDNELNQVTLLTVRVTGGTSVARGQLRFTAIKAQNP